MLSFVMLSLKSPLALKWTADLTHYSCGEKVVLQVLGIDRTYVGGLAVGFTTCSPDSVTQSELPDDADLLLDRNFNGFDENT
jgi:hypothetical protein